MRVGVAVRQKGQDGCVSSRIPGLATSNQGTLLAIFDARYDYSRDLQGNIDIALHRSTDQGLTWQPVQTVFLSTRIQASLTPLYFCGKPPHSPISNTV